MKHEILGEIIQSDGHPFDAVATIGYEAREVRLGIVGDGVAFERVLDLAAQLVKRLGELDALAKDVATRDLRETYNSGWNEYDEAQEDGSFKTVSNPKLSAAEFEAKLSLKSVNLTGDELIELFYDDEGMFWGHSLMVTSHRGLDFSEVSAEIWG